MSQSQPIYCIDTCSILEQGRNYPPDVFLDLWARIDGLVAAGRLISSEEVYRELVDNSVMDEAKQWAKNRQDMFVEISKDIEQVAIPIIQGYGQRLVNYRKPNSDGDPWVLATAIHKGCIIVTEEGRSGGPERVKIPDVCIERSIPYVNLLGLMRREGWGFRSL